MDRKKALNLREKKRGGKGSGDRSKATCDADKISRHPTKKSFRGEGESRAESQTSERLNLEKTTTRRRVKKRGGEDKGLPR